MRILTVRQPWAWAIIHGGKDVENRVRNIAGTYRGPVAIHVGLTWDGSPYDHAVIRAAHALQRVLDGLSLTERDTKVMEPQRGQIIGVVDLVGVHQGTNTKRDQFLAVRSCFQPGKRFGLCSGWALPDNWHLELANPRALAYPIPYKGALGLRELPEDVASKVMGALS